MACMLSLITNEVSRFPEVKPFFSHRERYPCLLDCNNKQQNVTLTFTVKDPILFNIIHDRIIKLLMYIVHLV